MWWRKFSLYAVIMAIFDKRWRTRAAAAVATDLLTDPDSIKPSEKKLKRAQERDPEYQKLKKELEEAKETMIQHLKKKRKNQKIKTPIGDKAFPLE